jgi:peptidoglycan hydrolase-like amidase
LESRSPNINKIVDETRGEIISYNWKIIKPWYFSSSTWRTLSFYEYCRLKYSNEICTLKSKSYPYLQSVLDKWSEWMLKRWHWVWISWAWVSYFTKKWWTYDMIIKYFLKGVDII